MTIGDRARQPSPVGRNWRRAAIGTFGVVIGGVFLWLALRHIDPGDLERALREMEGKWLITGVAVYLAAIGLRCLRWGILLRATGSVKWRHAARAGRRAVPRRLRPPRLQYEPLYGVGHHHRRAGL